MDSEIEVALYYPCIDIADDSLIKTAALYWDELQTIVTVPFTLCPVSREGIEDTYSTYLSLISREANQAGFLKPRIVEKGDSTFEKAAAEFCRDIIQEYVKHPMIAACQNIYNDRWMLLPSGAMPSNYASILKTFVSYDEPNILRGLFDQDRLAVPAALGNIYLCRLASIVAQKDNTVPLTSLSSCQDILANRFIDYSKERRQNQMELVKLSLQTIAVNPDVPLMTILKFRDKHRKDLINYRKHIRKLVRQISKGLTNSEKQSLFEEMVKDEFLPVKKEVEAKLLENAGWFMINNTAIMVAATGTILLTGGQAWLAGLLQGIVSLGINVLGNIRDDRKCVKNHPLGYLYQAQKKFGANK